MITAIVCTIALGAVAVSYMLEPVKKPAESTEVLRERGK